MESVLRVRGGERKGRVLQRVPGQPVLQVLGQAGQPLPHHFQVRHFSFTMGGEILDMSY